MWADEVLEVVGRVGVLRTRDLPGCQRAAARLAERGVLVRLLPGIYCAAGMQADLETRCAALMLWDEDAVITGMAAARLTYWKDAPVGVVEFHSTRKKSAPPWARLHRTAVPPEDVVYRGGLRLTSAAATAVDLSSRDDGAAIDRAFYERVITLNHLDGALQRRPHRHGNTTRRAVVQASRHEPWSQGERRLHRMLSDEGILGWVTNHPIRGRSKRRHLDVAFLRERVVIEFDGREFHGMDQFESDRVRHNDLVWAGWQVLRVTWAMLDNPGELFDLIREVLAQRRVEQELLGRAFA